MFSLILLPSGVSSITVVDYNPDSPIGRLENPGHISCLPPGIRGRCWLFHSLWTLSLSQVILPRRSMADPKGLQKLTHSLGICMNIVSARRALSFLEAELHEFSQIWQALGFDFFLHLLSLSLCYLFLAGPVVVRWW